ncbi:hypothetical protein ACFOEQ_07095 [Chryseobacterium arachidis]
MQTIPTFLLGTAIVTGVSFCQAQNKKTSIAESNPLLIQKKAIML